MLADYPQYWAPGSKWHRMYSQMEGPNPVFDSYMQVGGDSPWEEGGGGG